MRQDASVVVSGPDDDRVPALRMRHVLRVHRPALAVAGNVAPTPGRLRDGHVRSPPGSPRRRRAASRASRMCSRMAVRAARWSWEAMASAMRR